MEGKRSTEASIIRSDAIEEGHITLFGLATNESMSDISSVSELESELGYASCENEDDSLDSCVSDGRQHRLKATRRKLQRKHRLDQLRRYAVYSNDSDTTIDDTVVNARRLRRTAPKKEKVVTVHMKSVSVKSKERTSNEFRRPRNGSKGSWTDSGVSMSKTDSQPSTLGERTKSKMMSNKFMTKNELKVKSSEKTDDLRSRIEASPVELLRGEIRRRSRSLSEFTKNLSDHRRENCEGVEPTPASNVAENAAWKNKAVGLADGKPNETVGKVGGKIRYPEIIRLEDKEKSVKVKKVSSKRNNGKEVRSDAIKAEVMKGEEADFDDLNEKESEIIQKLLENAKEAESKRKHSVQSHCSHSTTSEGTADGTEHVRPRRSKLQKLKDIFFRVHKSRNGGIANLSPLKKEALGLGQSSSPSFDSYFSDDTSAQSACTEHLCYCGYDDYDSTGLDQLSHLGRVVQAKKRNVLSRFFRSISRSSDNVQARSGRVNRARSQISSDVPMGRKRSGSTRSLPESLKYLYLKALSKSVDNVNSEKLPTFLQEAGVFSPNPGFYVKRSRSSSSLAKCQFVSNFPTDISRSTDAISYYSQNIRSPPSAVRRSESLRSLNIGRNYDIATHVLQSPATVEDVKENNNLLYHPFFEGHTTRDDCSTSKSQNKDGSSCTCYLKRNHDGFMGSGFISSPLSSPRPYCKGHPSLSGNGQSCFVSNSGYPNEAGKLLSPRRRASRETLCGCQENFFEANYFFAGDQCARGEIENTQIVRQTEAPQEESSCRRTERGDSDCLVIAPLEVRVTREKHAERVKLKTAKDFDSSV